MDKVIYLNASDVAAFINKNKFKSNRDIVLKILNNQYNDLYNNCVSDVDVIVNDIINNNISNKIDDIKYFTNIKVLNEINDRNKEIEIINDKELINDDKLISDDYLIKDDELIKNVELIKDDDLIKDIELIKDEEIFKDNQLINDNLIEQELIKDIDIIKDIELIKNEELFKDIELIENDKLFKNDLIEKEINKELIKDIDIIKDKELIKCLIKDENIIDNNIKNITYNKEKVEKAYDEIKTNLINDVMNNIKENMINIDNKIIIENTNKILENNITLNTGIIYEPKIIQKVENNFNMEIINRNTEIKYINIKLKDGYLLKVGGKIDGMNNNELIEVKHRKYKLLNYVPVYEKIQVQTYMQMFGFDSCKFVEEYNNEIKTYNINKENNEWSKIRKDLIYHGNNLVELLQDNNKLFEYL